MISACPSCQGVRRSVRDPEAFAPGRTHLPSRRSGKVIGTDRRMSEPPCACQGVPHGQTESGGIVLAAVLPSYAGARAPRGGVTRQGVVLADLQSLLDCQLNVSLSRALSLYLCPHRHTHFLVLFRSLERARARALSPSTTTVPFL